MCKATLDFVEHHQSTSLASLLQRRQAQRLHEHVVDTRGVPKPVEDEAFRSPLRPGLLRSWQGFSASMGLRQTQHTPTVGGRRLYTLFP